MVDIDGGCMDVNTTEYQDSAERLMKMYVLRSQGLGRRGSIG